MANRGLSYELRRGHTPDLERRRLVVVLSLLGGALANMVGLYQFGLLRKAPDLPTDLFDATSVDRSSQGYSRLETPDAYLIGLGFSLTAALAAAGGRSRAETRPWLPLLMLGVSAVGAAGGVGLAVESAGKAKRGGWRQTVAAASAASLLLALPEAARAVRALRR